MAARTEAQVTADVVVALVHAGLISDQRATSTITAALQIRESDLAEASQRARDRDGRWIVPHRVHPTYPYGQHASKVGYVPPANSPKPFDPIESADRGLNPDNNKPYAGDPDQDDSDDLERRRRDWLASTGRTSDGGVTLRCTGMRINPVHYAPPGEFDRNPQHPHREKSCCRRCMADYQSARHLKVSQLDQLTRIGIGFELVDGDGTFVCAVCSLPVDAGHKAYVHGSIAHAECAALDDNDEEE